MLHDKMNKYIDKQAAWYNDAWAVTEPVLKEIGSKAKDAWTVSKPWLKWGGGKAKDLAKYVWEKPGRSMAIGAVPILAYEYGKHVASDMSDRAALNRARRRGIPEDILEPTLNKQSMYKYSEYDRPLMPGEYEQILKEAGYIKPLLLDKCTNLIKYAEYDRPLMPGEYEQMLKEAGIWDMALKGVMNGAKYLRAAPGAMQKAWGGLQKGWGGLKNSVQTAYQNGGIGNVAQKAWNKAGDIGHQMWNAAGNMGATALNNAQKAGTNFVNGRSAWQVTKDTAKGAWNGISNAYKGMKNWGTDAGAYIGNGIKHYGQNVGKTLKNPNATIGDTFNAMAQPFKQGWQGAKEMGKNMWQGAKTMGQNMQQGWQQGAELSKQLAPTITKASSYRLRRYIVKRFLNK